LNGGADSFAGSRRVSLIERFGSVSWGDTPSILTRLGAGMSPIDRFPG